MIQKAPINISIGMHGRRIRVNMNYHPMCVIKLFQATTCKLRQKMEQTNSRIFLQIYIGIITANFRFRNSILFVVSVSCIEVKFCRERNNRE